ncbi:MAG: metallophosphoesterase [Spirochaetales bacterium]|nr:metallophosphoesterase [Spirochaetales bacterium]
MGIFITGDLHGGLDIKKLSNKSFKQGQHLTKKDFLIIAGDFGLVWDESREERYWLDWLNERAYTVLFIDGNHENFNLLNTYDVDEWNNGKMHRLRPHVYHLMRGQVFNLSGKKFFTFGGAVSIDKEYRVENESWWPQELPSDSEYNEGMYNLKMNRFKVDYIITHTCSTIMLTRLKNLYPEKKALSKINTYFDMVEDKVTFEHWYFGHFHRDENVDTRHTALYNTVRQIEA